MDKWSEKDTIQNEIELMKEFFTSNKELKDNKKEEKIDYVHNFENQIPDILYNRKTNKFKKKKK